jgi:hypothetical protein
MSNERTITADIAPGRDLIEFTCRCGISRCGITISLCLTPADPRLCIDCRDDDDRAAHGWTPENSLS